VVNSDSPIDLIGMALQLGVSFAARSFSGDKAQLVPLIKAAIAHPGSAVIDIVSPCVAFNNHSGSTKSYDYVRAHNDSVNRLDLIPMRKEISVDFPMGSDTQIEQHDGSVLRLHKLSREYDATDRIAAINYLLKHQAQGDVVTGLLFIDPNAQDLHKHLNTVATPLNQLSEAELCPSAAVLERLNQGFR
jgi:2-oxoglutarate/2-oxoacid ferredoxin oxidoreductase subunit beta